DPALQLVSKNLQPESVRSVEASFRQRFGAHSLVFGVFGSWWSNMIVRHELISSLTATLADAQIVSDAQRAGLLNQLAQDAVQYQTLGSIRDLGFNGGCEGTSVEGRLAYGLNITAAYARGITPTGDQLLTVSPSWFGNARASYDFGEAFPTL